ncbi:hypothetical protein KC315_g12071 [Hortaea werneckii]|nr:hypothetical protein KC315_g12071 [Hortaea werneckii]
MAHSFPSGCAQDDSTEWNLDSIQETESGVTATAFDFDRAQDAQCDLSIYSMPEQPVAPGHESSYFDISPGQRSAGAFTISEVCNMLAQHLHHTSEAVKDDRQSNRETFLTLQDLHQSLVNVGDALSKRLDDADKLLQGLENQAATSSQLGKLDDSLKQLDSGIHSKLEHLDEVTSKLQSQVDDRLSISSRLEVQVDQHENLFVLLGEKTELLSERLTRNCSLWESHLRHNYEILAVLAEVVQPTAPPQYRTMLSNLFSNEDREDGVV